MVGSFSNRERRSYPRFIIDLPLEYRDTNGPCLRGGIVVNASEGGPHRSNQRHPCWYGINIAVLFPKGFELANFKVMAKIVWKEPYRKEDWKGLPCREGYQYGLEFIQISEEDHWELDLLLSGQYTLEEMLTINSSCPFLLHDLTPSLCHTLITYLMSRRWSPQFYLQISSSLLSNWNPPSNSH